MNILLLITRGDSIGGAQIHLKDIAKKLQDEGHEVTILFGKTGVFSNLLDEMGIKYHIVNNLVREINIIQDFKALKNIIQEIKNIKPDIIAIHSSKTGILGRIAAKITNTPVVFTAHGWAFTEGISPKKRIIYKWIEKLGASFSDRIITVSKYDKQLALKNFVGSEEKIIAIQNGMNDISKSLFATPDIAPLRIIMIARFQQQKDHISLIKALSELKNLAWTLQFVGEDGGTQQEVLNLSAKLGVLNRIEFLGNRSDVDELLSKSQIFVLTSFWEGFPLTIIEAMRAGLPVIASNVGGVNEAVINGETGYVIKNFDELVNKLKVLIETPAQRLQMGRQGRIRYEENFTFDHMYKQTYEVYKNVIQNKRTRI